MLTCRFCALVGGRCWACRAGVARLRDVADYEPLLLSWGAAGGPAIPRPTPVPEAGAEPALGEWDYVTTARLVEDTGRLRDRLPPDIDLVVAIARSGLLPGSLIATDLHLPLRTVSRGRGLTDPGHGGRMEGRADRPPRHVLLIDDTVAHGREMSANLPTVQAAFPGAKVTRAVVYAHPQARDAVDHYVMLYRGQHFLEWNWANAGHGAACGFDFDGILCRDFSPTECATPEAYRAAMASIRPLYLPRRTTVPLVVTARHESTRDLTEAWLDRHGVRVDRLVMRDWGTIADHTHDPDRIATWKAEHYAASQCTLFAESDPGQAEAINRLSGRPVLCPAAGRVFPPAQPQPKPAPPRNPHWARLSAAKACPHRSDAETCGCQAGTARCGLGKGSFEGGAVAVLSDCLNCDRSPVE